MAEAMTSVTNVDGHGCFLLDWNDNLKISLAYYKDEASMKVLIYSMLRALDDVMKTFWKLERSSWVQVCKYTRKRSKLKHQI